MKLKGKNRNGNKEDKIFFGGIKYRLCPVKNERITSFLMAPRQVFSKHKVLRNCRDFDTSIHTFAQSGERFDPETRQIAQKELIRALPR